MKISDLIEQEPFSILLKIKPDILASIKADMITNGYDESQPITVWGNIIIDGHTRTRAAKEVGIEDIPVFSKEFENEDDALAYAIHNQRDRRNMDPGEKRRLILAGDKLRERGGWHGNRYTGSLAKGSEDLFAKSSADETAELVGCGPATVKRIRGIEKYAPELGEEIDKGTLSINKAHKMAMEKKRAILPPAKKISIKNKPHPTVNSVQPSIAKHIVESCKIQLARIPRNDPLREIGLEDLIQHIKSIM